MEKHKSVLMQESIEYLNLKEDGTYVDCTLGFGGHSSEILKRIKRGKLFAFDQDMQAVNYSQERLGQIGSNFEIIHCNFSKMKEELLDRGVTQVDGILFDLGVSSPQLDDKSRGFSYQADAFLDMRMNQDQSLTAYQVVNEYSYHDLLTIFYNYGEEKYAKNIASNIVKARETRNIETTLELVDIIYNSVPEKYKRGKHPARKIFQAIRIEVNKELEILEQALLDAISMLAPGGRLCVITFHSLEDRICKQLFKKMSMIDERVRGLPEIPKEYQPELVLVQRKAITPNKKELEENHRARSAKLRVVEKNKKDV